LLPKESGFFQTVACQTSSVFQRLNVVVVVVVVVVGIIIIVPTFLLFASQNSCHIYIYIHYFFAIVFTSSSWVQSDYGVHFLSHNKGALTMYSKDFKVFVVC
jgi:hypothetical protein